MSERIEGYCMKCGSNLLYYASLGNLLGKSFHVIFCKNCESAHNPKHYGVRVDE
jgi:hypothetical protein